MISGSTVLGGKQRVCSSTWQSSAAHAVRFKSSAPDDRPDVPADKENGTIMATRAPRNTAEKATAGPTETPALAQVPAAWGTEPIEEFAGHDLTEKKELVGQPFLIIGAEIERNENRGYDVAYVYALDVNGTEFEFSDTSTTGVRTQVQAMLADKGLNPAAGGGFQKLRVAIMKGLRVSEFEFLDEETGNKKKAAVYYLSASGRAQEAA